MIQMWKDLMATMFSCIDEKLVDFVFVGGGYRLLTPESFIEHMLLEFCKYSYYKKAPKHPLRYYIPYDFTDNNDRMTYSRTFKYIQKYKDRNYSTLEKLSEDPEKYSVLKAKPMNTISERIEGYEISEMDFFEANTIHDMELVKAIAENRIYSTKKTSNTRFIEMFATYDEWVNELIESSKKSDEDMVFASIAFFTFEWKYAIEFYYHLTEYMIEFNVETFDFYTTHLMTGTFQFESLFGGTIRTDSRFIKDRIGLIPVFFYEELDPITMDLHKRKYLELLTLQAVLKEMDCNEGGKYIDWFSNNTDITDLASFFRDYDVFQIWRPKSFDNKTIRTMRYVLETSSTFNKKM